MYENILDQVTSILRPSFFGGKSHSEFLIDVGLNLRYLRLTKFFLGDKSSFCFKKVRFFGKDGIEILNYDVELSSNYPPYCSDPGPSDLVNGFHTQKEMNPNVKVIFKEEVYIDKILITNRTDVLGVKNRNFYIEYSTNNDNWNKFYDHFQFIDNTFLNAKNWINFNVKIEDLNLKVMLEFYLNMLLEFSKGKMLNKQYLKNKAKLVNISEDSLNKLITFYNQNILFEYGYEITGHGCNKTFRFWSESEKKKYLLSIVSLSKDLSKLTSNVCLGYGAVLSYVRNGDLIPHDDDLDLLIAFQRNESIIDITTALLKVEKFLKDLSYNVSGKWPSHRWVKKDNFTIDVFVGLIEEEYVSFFPGPRKKIKSKDVFPPSYGSMFDVTFPFPNNPIEYLNLLYGKDWRHPQPNFKHDWSGKGYGDILP